MRVFLRRISELDANLKRRSDPWFMPHGLLFWWVWRPLLCVVFCGAVVGLCLVLAEGVVRLLGIDREIWIIVLVSWAVIWILCRVERRR